MKRRDFITLLGGAAAAYPLAARAQKPAIPVVGYLHSGSADVLAHQVAEFRKGLAEAGFAEGRNVAVEYRWADLHIERLPEMASELVRRRVTVIVAGGGQVTPLAAKAATATIPIVFAAGGDPVRSGLVTSLGRPGENITGVSLFSAILYSKRLELLNELVPAVALVGFLNNPQGRDSSSDVKDAQVAAHALGKELIVLDVSTGPSLDAAFATLNRRKAGAVTFASDPIFASRRRQIIGLAAHYGIPAIFSSREHAASGGLMSYGDDFALAYRQVGVYVGRILQGAKPADLPIIQPTKFELAVNLRTARALGLKIPEGFLLRADEVIE